jgi:hypothetical protein
MTYGSRSSIFGGCINVAMKKIGVEDDGDLEGLRTEEGCMAERHLREILAVSRGDTRTLYRTAQYCSEPGILCSCLGKILFYRMKFKFSCPSPFGLSRGCAARA